MRVCVIGAGFAGLAAADRLAAAGAEVVVLEARDRVGGRVWSDALATGAVVERGAEFITAGYDLTERYAERLGLRLVGMGIRYPDRRLVPDQGIRREAALAAARAVERVAATDPHAPATAVLERVVDDPRIRELLGSRLQSARAHPLADLSAAFLAGIAKYLDVEETRRLEGGNARLAEGLAAGLDVRLRTPARAVEHGRDGVRVRLDDGAVEADALVCALPATVLRELPFDPVLPPAMRSALAAVRFGIAAKLAAPLAAPVAPDAPMSVARRFWAYVSPCDGVGGRTVGSWAGSAPVVDDLGGNDGAARWLDAIDELWPGLPIERDGAVVTTWRDDPWARGVYSVLPPAADAAAVAPLATPVGRVAFAGEHTSHDWGATIEGALRSGERAAAEVLAAGA